MTARQIVLPAAVSATIWSAQFGSIMHPTVLGFMGLMPGSFFFSLIVYACFLSISKDEENNQCVGAVRSKVGDWPEFCVLVAIGAICLLDGLCAAYTATGLYIFYDNTYVTVPFLMYSFAAPVPFMIAFKEFGFKVNKSPATPAKE